MQRKPKSRHEQAEQQASLRSAHVETCCSCHELCQDCAATVFSGASQSEVLPELLARLSPKPFSQSTLRGSSGSNLCMKTSALQTRML